MLVKSITEEEIYGIGHAFGYYEYGEETGMSAAFSGKEAQSSKAHSRFLLQVRLFCQRLAKLTILCYYFNPKTQRLKYQ